MPELPHGVNILLARCAYSGFLGAVLGSGFSAFCYLDDNIRKGVRLPLPGTALQVVKDGYQISRYFTLGMGAMCGTSLLIHGNSNYDKLIELPLGQGNEFPLWVGSGISFLAMNPFQTKSSVKIRAAQAAALATAVTAIVTIAGALKNK